MTTILKVNINDLNSNFFLDLGQRLGNADEVEIRIPKQKQKEKLFTDKQFWQLINLLDWSQKKSTDILAPAVKELSLMSVVNIYLFADKLSEKLFLLDTRAHGDAYLKNEGDDYLSVDDFLYIRCAVVAEGKSYFEKVLSDPTLFPSDIDFEPLLGLANTAYQLKTGRSFGYYPVWQKRG